MTASTFARPALACLAAVDVPSEISVWNSQISRLSPSSLSTFSWSFLLSFCQEAIRCVCVCLDGAPHVYTSASSWVSLRDGSCDLPRDAYNRHVIPFFAQSPVMEGMEKKNSEKKWKNERKKKLSACIQFERAVVTALWLFLRCLFVTFTITISFLFFIASPNHFVIGRSVASTALLMIHVSLFIL